MTLKPSSTHLARNLCMAFVWYTLIVSIAPEEALETTGERGAEFFAHTTTPSMFKKCAVRRMAPKFCGSMISSSASQRECSRFLSVSAAFFPLPFSSNKLSMFSISKDVQSKATPWCGLDSVSMFKSCFVAYEIVHPNSFALAIIFSSDE